MSRPITGGISFHLHLQGELAAERRLEEDSALDIAVAVLTEVQCPVHSRRALPVVPTAPHISVLTLGFQCSSPDEVIENERLVQEALGDRVTDQWRTS